MCIRDGRDPLTFERISPTTGGAIEDSDGTTLTFPAEGVLANFQAQIKSTPRTDFIEGQAGSDLYAAAQSLPDTLIAKSPVYHVELRGRAPGQSTGATPIHDGSLPYDTLALYDLAGDSRCLAPSPLAWR